MAVAIEPDGNVRKIESEAEKAARHKRALNEVLGPVVAACEAARQDGFMVEYQINLNPYGVYALVMPPTLVKRY